MKRFTVEDAVKATGGEYFGSDEAKKTELMGVERDSRVIKEGWVFIAICGETNDGHDFIDDVFEKGAALVVSEKKLDNPKGAYVLVEDSVRALQLIAREYRKTLQASGTKIIGVTGSVGKTSTKEMLFAVLSEGFKASKTEGNYNNGIGVPLTLCAIDPDVQTAVVEMGINHYGEMDVLGDIVSPDIMLFTNIGESHIGNFGSREGILKGKTEVLNHMRDDALVVINGDDDQLIKLLNTCDKKIYTFSLNDASADVYVSDIEEKGIYGSDITLKTSDYTDTVHLPIPGIHMVKNAASAALVGTILKMDKESIFKGISSAQAQPGRGRIIRNNDFMIIDDTYNASPTAVKASIDLLLTSNERKVAILGDMFELGDEEKRLHYETGFYAGKKRPDVIIAIGNLSKDIAEGAKYALKTTKVPEGEEEKEVIVKWFEDKESFMDKSDEYIKKGDAVLLKASHGMRFEKLLEFIQEKDF